MIGTPKVDDSESRINNNSMVGSTSFSLAKECKRLCENKIRINGVKSYRKCKKREGITQVKKEFITYNIRMML